MATKAYVLINIKPGKTPGVVKTLLKIPQIKVVHPCWGKPDIFTYVEVENEKALSDLVLTKIHSLEGIETTDTHLVLEI